MAEDDLVARLRETPKCPDCGCGMDDHGAIRECPMCRYSKTPETTEDDRDIVARLRDYAADDSLAVEAADTIERLRATIEIERMRLAGCSTASIQNTETSLADRIAADHPYYSAAYGDICRAVDREIEHREKRAQAEATVVRLTAELESRTAEVEHWVTKHRELDQWRAQTSRLHLQAEARATAAETQLDFWRKQYTGT